MMTRGPNYLARNRDPPSSSVWTSSGPHYVMPRLSKQWVHRIHKRV